MIECVAVACTRITISMIMRIISALTAVQKWMEVLTDGC